MNRLITIVTFLLIGFYYTSTAQTWQKSFSAGNTDINGEFMGGSEVLNLVGHKKKLFASVGYWEDETNIWYGGSNPNLGWGQIICLETANGSWNEDLDMSANHLRPEILKQVIFTLDSLGNPLTSPDTLLIAAAYSPNYFTSTVSARTFTRNDSNGTWEQSLIYQGGLPAGENYSIRDMQVFTDQITGVEKLYITVGTKGIFAGIYDPNTTGKIQWNETPEFGPVNIRPLGITSANNTLYFSSGNKLYKRNDGIIPTYSVAHDFSDLNPNVNSAVGGIRGLTTISNPGGNDEALLLMWCPNGQSQGVIYHLEPDDNEGFNRIYEAKISQVVEEYLPSTNVSYLLGAYNEFYEIEDPITKETYHIIGIEASISGGNYPIWNGFYKGGMFVKRDNDMQYTLEEIDGFIGTNDTALVANRCYVKSPFDDENAIYFGGFDPNGFTSTNMAWIYKKEWQSNSVDMSPSEKSEILAYPCPTSDYLHVEINSNRFDHYKIISLFGETSKSGIVSQGKQIIDVSKLPSNIYILRIGNKTIKLLICE
jgi:hypothetical protein